MVAYARAKTPPARVVNQNFAHSKAATGYRFKDRDPVLDVVVAAIESSGQTYQQIAEGSGVGRQTISRWCYREVATRPFHITLHAVMSYLGYEEHWIKRSEGTH